MEEDDDKPNIPNEPTEQQVLQFIQDFDDNMTCKCMGDNKSSYYKYTKIDGQYYKRDTTYYDVNELCHDCGVENVKGNTHHGTCDIEQCPACRRPILVRW